MINNIKEYFEVVLGISVEIESFNEKGKLPFFLRTNYSINILKLPDHTFLLIRPFDESEITPSNYKKHLSVLEEYSGLKPILSLTGIDTFLRKRLIEFKIPFIVPGTQIYLPDLMIDLREYFSKKNKKKEKISPSAQVVLLYDIYNKVQKPITPVELAMKCGYTKMTMSRVIDELESIGVCRVEQKGKNRFAWIEPESGELWEKVKKDLRSPVWKKVYAQTSDQMLQTRIPLAGISALAELTMISPSSCPVFAVSKKQFSVIKSQNEIRVVKDEFDSQFELEIWYYSPALFGGLKTVDNLSLYLSLRDQDDERIQHSLKNLMENF